VNAFPGMTGVKS